MFSFRHSWLVTFLVLGGALRVVRYAMCYPMWGDECMYAANLLDRNWLDAAAPLEQRQVAPLGFTFLEIVTSQALGFSEYSLRLFPLLCGLGGFLLSAAFFWRNLPTRPATFAVAILAVSSYPVRLSSDIKPYSSDLLASAILLFLASEWFRNRESPWLWSLGLAAPLVVLISFPSVFVGGSVAAVLAMNAMRAKRRSDWIAMSLFALLLGAAFFLSLKLSTTAQYAEHAAFMKSYWAEYLPPRLDHPLSLAWWFLDTHIGAMFAHPIGDRHGGSLLTVVAFVAGLAWLWRHNQRDLSVTFLGIMAIGLVAAILGKYPYGAPRLSQHLAPAICFAGGAGIDAIFCYIRSRAPKSLPSATGASELRATDSGSRLVLYGCLAIGIVMLSISVAFPYRERHDYQHREFARAFWRELRETPTLCAIRDQRQTLYVDRSVGSPDAAAYVCYQAIYRKMPIPSVEAADELTCVVYRSRGAEPQSSALETWRSDLENRTNSYPRKNGRPLRLERVTSTPTKSIG